MTGTSRRNALFGPLAVIVLSCLVFLVAHRQALLDPYVINDDVRQQLYWMASWEEPGLFPPNLLNEYSRLYVPPGVKAVYRALSPVIDPVQASKAVTGALFVIFCLAMYGIGEALGGRRLGFACACACWLMPYFLYNISGGLSRAFAAPLLALFLLSWVRRFSPGVALSLLLQAVLIPYICILSSLACVMAFAAGKIRGRALPPFPRRKSHFIVMIACAAAVYAMQSRMNASGFGPLAGVSDMLGDPLFGHQGRLDLFPLPNPFLDLVYWPFERIGLFLECGLAVGIASLAAIAALVYAGARRFDWKSLVPYLSPFAWLAAASLLLYANARVFALKLFVPDRYVSYSFNIFYALALAVCVLAALRPLLARKRAGAVLVLLAACLGAWRLTGAGLYDYSGFAPVYAAVRELPKDALLAGHPEDMDNILTFGQRDVLASFELAHPWSLGYWSRFEPRLSDMLAAYYAHDPRTVRDFAEKYGVDAFVVSEARYDGEYIEKGACFAPYGDMIRELAQKGGTFALLDEGNFPYKVLAPGVRLVDVRPKAGG